MLWRSAVRLVRRWSTIVDAIFERPALGTAGVHRLAMVRAGSTSASRSCVVKSCAFWSDAPVGEATTMKLICHDCYFY